MSTASKEPVQEPAHRAVRLGAPGLEIVRRPDGCILARSPRPLPSHPHKLSDRLEHWSRTAPDRVFLGQRTEGQSWRTITFGTFHEKVRGIAQALLKRGLSSERPLAVLSGNDIEHALIMPAAMYAGIPYAPIARGHHDIKIVRAVIGQPRRQNLQLEFRRQKGCALQTLDYVE